MFTKNSLLSKDHKNYGTKVVNEGQKDATQKMIDDLKSQLKTVMVDLEWANKVNQSLKKNIDTFEVMEDAASSTCFNKYFTDRYTNRNLLQEYHAACEYSDFDYSADIKIKDVALRFRNKINELVTKLTQQVQGLVKDVDFLTEQQPKQAKPIAPPRYY